MQSVAAGFTAEARDSTRKIAHGVSLAWKKDLDPTISLFTIGVSTIGGSDVIAGPSGVQSAWNRYLYEDESDYVTSIDYERSLQMPIGGISKSLADVQLENTSGRFTPRFMGGDSALYTAVTKLKRPIIINAGFNYGGVDNTIPQFVGLTKRSPRIDMRSRTVELTAIDFIEFISNRYVDNTSMFTGLRSDEVLANLLAAQGFGTAQYELDYGINVINFGIFNKGDKIIDIIDKIVKAEMGHFYQDEEGVLRFENRQHWDSSPHNAVTQVIYTADVLESESPDEDHIINVVEIKSQPRAKQPNQLVFKLASPLEIPASSDKEFFVNFDDPMLAIDPPVFVANEQSDGSGTIRTANIGLKSSDEFAQAAKYVFNNNHTTEVFITDLTIYGRPAKITTDLYYRTQDDSSVTAFDERPLTIENDYIQNSDWANSLSQLILNDFSDVENLQKIVIRAKPHLQLGDLISWQGRYWRIFGIKTQIDASIGFVQELSLLQRTIQTYFRIGISTIGGNDLIAA